MIDVEWSNDRVIAAQLSAAAAYIAGTGATNTTMLAAEVLVLASFQRMIVTVASARGETRLH